MKISKEAQYLSRQLFDAAFADGRLEESRALTIAETIEQTRPRHAFQILKEFTRLMRLELAKHHALIESATALDEASMQTIKTALKQHDVQVAFSITTNPSLIGGARIQLGSDVWDGSIAAKLQKFASTT